MGFASRSYLRPGFHEERQFLYKSGFNLRKIHTNDTFLIYEKTVCVA